MGTGNIANTARGMIYREAVIKKMNRKSARKNLFITAPGGYGKTTAAEQWLSFVRGASARLRMGNEDNNTGVFYKKLICSLLKLVKKEKSANSAEFMLDTFLETLKQMPVKNTRCYLLIDDLHIIKNNDILNSLPLIAGRLPSYVCLCLISRSMPPQPLLDTGRFETLTKDDLLFSQEEVEWLGTERNRELTAEHIRDLLDTTGGWAMYLSALLSGEQTYKTPQTLIQYLETRVWNLWDDETKKLLVKLAVPVEITPDLCERLTTEADGKNILERLVKKEGVFLTLIGNGVYRFHDIFRDFLLERTKLLENQEIRRLNNVTAEWYYERGDYHAGAQYYIRNKDHEGITRCLTATSRYHEGFVMSVESIMGFINQYVKNLPAEFIAENLILTLRSSIAAFYSGDINGYIRYLDMLYEKQAEFAAKYPASLQTFDFIKGVDPRITFPEYIKGLIQTIPQMSKTTVSVKAHTATVTQNLPFFHRSMREFSEYHELKTEDLESLKNTIGVMIGKDYEVMEQALIAGLYYERGQLMDAARHALVGKEACLEGIHPETRFSANMILAAVLYAMGDFRDAGNVMAQTEIFVGEKARFLYPNFKALQTERVIRLGDIAAAKEWLAVYANSAERLPFYQICRHFTSLRSYIALEDYKAAVDFGRRIQQLAADYKRPLDRIESGILTAIALWKKGDKYNAAAEMEQALHIAAPYGFIQLFINEGKEILPLLWMICKKTDIDSQLAQFIDTLTRRISGFDEERKEPEQAPRLSVMRRKMLEYLNKGMSYNEIADKTGIVRGTVKRHILLLYKQLGVNSSEEAVIKAKMLGLLE